MATGTATEASRTPGWLLCYVDHHSRRTTEPEGQGLNGIRPPWQRHASSIGEIRVSWFAKVDAVASSQRGRVWRTNALLVATGVSM